VGLFAGAPDRCSRRACGAVLLVVLGGIFVADRNRAHSHITAQARYLPSASGNGSGYICFDSQTQASVPMSACDNEDFDGAVTSWRERKGWYEYAAGALVVLTLASAFALSRRTVAA
jgi:hypothetical protein